MTPAPTTNKRNQHQRLADLAQIERWVQRGKTPQQIAELLAAERSYRLSRRQVQYEIAKLDRLWKAEAVATVDQMKRLELRGLQDQENELWEAWERSKQDAVRKMASTEAGGKDGGKDKKSVTQEGQCGDPAYMRLILEIRDRRAKLLGLDEPVKQQVTSEVHVTEGGIDYSALTTEQLRVLEQIATQTRPDSDPPGVGGTQPA